MLPALPLRCVHVQGCANTQHKGRLLLKMLTTGDRHKCHDTTFCSPLSSHPQFSRLLVIFPSPIIIKARVQMLHKKPTCRCWECSTDILYLCFPLARCSWSCCFQSLCTCSWPFARLHLIGWRWQIFGGLFWPEGS